MNCPKCGYQQVDGPECPRCGIVIARFLSSMGHTDPDQQPGPDDDVKRPRPVRRFFRIFRWIVLIGLVVVLFLLFRTSTPPQIVVSPESARRAETKIQEFRSSLRQGAKQQLVMDEAELNGWLSENLALKKAAGNESAITPSPESSGNPAIPPPETSPLDSETLEQIQSNVRDVKIELLEDSLRVYARFDLHGVEMSLELEGRPEVHNGYIRLDPIGGKLGSLPLMAGTLRSAADRIFESPQNREKFKWPPDIQDVRIEQGQLVVIPR